MPTPVPGLVVRYSYLWWAEHLDGREEGGDASVAYGMLPPSLFANLKGQFLRLVEARIAKPVQRT